MNDNDKQFLNTLKQYNKDNLSKNIWIPSLERYVSFGTLTAKHQKDIIHATIDNPLLNLIFHDKVYKIFKELCEDPMIVDTFTIYDKDAILIQMRYHFVSKLYKGEDFTGVIEYIKTIKEDLTLKENDSGNINIEYQIPNLSQEKKMYDGFKKVRSYKVASDDENEVRAIITDVYVLELMKYSTFRK